MTLPLVLKAQDLKIFALEEEDWEIFELDLAVVSEELEVVSALLEVREREDLEISWDLWQQLLPHPLQVPHLFEDACLFGQKL